MPVDYKELKKERMNDWRVDLHNSKEAKERVKGDRVKMPENEPMKRNKTFFEVNIGLSVQQAREEAARCLDCPTPTCISGCPVNINIPGFVKEVDRKSVV